MGTSSAPLAGVRIIESSMLGPAAITTSLADLGAEVIKIESPQGDYIRQMTWPIVEGVSLMHLHVNRGKRSLVLDLRTPEGVQTYLDLVRDADVVIEAMRPGGLERRGLGYDQLREVNPKIVFCTISGYGMTGPYAELPSHGVAYDVWAGLVKPETTEDGFAAIPEHPSMGIHAGPLFGALGVLAGVIKARATGEGCRLEVAQSDAAAAMDWYRSESWKAYERPESEVTGNASDGYVRRAPGTAGMRDGVRYQFYEASDGGHVLLQASEREFWENFCRGIDRPELFEANPGAKFADHAVGNVALRTQLKEIFLTRTAREWVDLGLEINVPIINVNTPQTLADDPQFQARFPWIPAERLGCEQQPSPIKYLDVEVPVPTKAPTVGQHTDEVLAEVLGYDAERIAALREAGALG
ncbi:CoA transferase [Aquihabitans sp. G128]|uniref:CaiB/BaiF CoA transferase family protein n=1 Tax=Aquihabitans sp. G128 TaxID=2849779 RepID=UPI001C226DEA|nr:CoA transferase [Aquihabitans sp. G128]QXC62941.1 CoA transferase [Aquihabitans sp. G128]